MDWLLDATVIVAVVTSIGNVVMKILDIKQGKVKDVLKRMDKIEDKVDQIGESQMALSRDRIKHIGNAYIQKGSITAEELDDIISLHRAYHNLGGNGFCDTIMDAVKSLPIK